MHTFVLGEAGASACPSGSAQFSSLEKCTDLYHVANITSTFVDKQPNKPEGCFLDAANRRVGFNSSPLRPGDMPDVCWGSERWFYGIGGATLLAVAALFPYCGYKSDHYAYESEWESNVWIFSVVPLVGTIVLWSFWIACSVTDRTQQLAFCFVACVIGILWTLGYCMGLLKFDQEDPGGNTISVMLFNMMCIGVGFLAFAIVGMTHGYRVFGLSAAVALPLPARPADEIPICEVFGKQSVVVHNTTSSKAPPAYYGYMKDKRGCCEDNTSTPVVNWCESPRNVTTIATYD